MFMYVLSASHACCLSADKKTCKDHMQADKHNHKVSVEEVGVTFTLSVDSKKQRTIGSPCKTGWLAMRCINLFRSVWRSKVDGVGYK